jgi:hypothetical protein
MTVTMSYQESLILKSLAARAAIADLSVRQHRAFEAGDAATWLGTFLVEGVLEVPGSEPIAGHPRLAAWFTRAGRGSRALATDSVVVVQGVTATQTSTVLVIAGREIEAMFTADDELTFERGRWYFARRRVVPA